MEMEHGKDRLLKCDVLIVGAGISGLTAARELRKKCPELSIKIVEAKNRVGGRTYTTTLKTANGVDRWDLGGHWVGRTQCHILELLKELNLETYPQFDEGIHLVQAGGLDIRPYNSSLPSINDIRHFSVWEALDFVRTINRLERMCARLNADDPFSLPNVADWDDSSFGEWTKAHCASKIAIECADISAQVICGTPAKRISLLYFLYFARRAGRFSDLFETNGDGAQAFRIKGGAQQISLLMAEEFKEDLLFETAISEISIVTSERALVHAHSTAEARQHQVTTFLCSRVILAISPSECGRIRFTPALSLVKRRIFDCTPQGNLLKCILTYRTSFWKEKGFAGQILSNGHSADHDAILPVMCTFDATTSDGNAAIVAFLHNEPWTEAPFEERRHAVVQDLCRFLGDEAADYIDYEDKDWHREPYNGGCPTAYTAPGHFDALLQIREPFYLVHFAATETATLWPGYMSGAVQAGLRAAHEVIWHVRRDLANEEHLKGTVYDKDYECPAEPREDLSHEVRRSVWPRRILLAALIGLGILASSKKYRLSVTARVFRPVERVVYEWYTGKGWPF